MSAPAGQFFADYRDSFPEGAAAIAAFYSEPCVTARGGVVRVNSTHQDTVALFSQVDEQYHARGFTHADFVLEQVRDLGSNSFMATVQWTYKGKDGQALWETTFSYNVYKRDGAWKILLQTMHDEG